MYPYIAEFWGTLLLVGTIAWIQNAYATGVALTAAILLVGSVSGGHFNPAVSVWAWLSGTLSAIDLGLYVAAQTAAAATVYGIGKFLL